MLLSREMVEGRDLFPMRGLIWNTPSPVVSFDSSSSMVFFVFFLTLVSDLAWVLAYSANSSRGIS